MENAEIFSFPTVIGSGGRGQSLHNEIFAKPLSCHYPTFLLAFGKRFVSFVPRSLYHTYRRLYANTTSHHKKHTPKPWPTRWKPPETKGSLPSPPLQRIAPVVHMPDEGDGQTRPSASDVSAIGASTTTTPPSEFSCRPTARFCQ